MIKTLSIPQELEDFLVANPDLSPSKMLQSKIIEIREHRRINSAENMRLIRMNKFLTNKLQEANEKIEILEESKRD